MHEVKKYYCKVIFDKFILMFLCKERIVYYCDSESDILKSIPLLFVSTICNKLYFIDFLLFPSLFLCENYVLVTLFSWIMLHQDGKQVDRNSYLYLPDRLDT